MKHIETTATAIRKLKSEAKKIKLAQGIALSEALEISARNAGYENYHHATTCAKNTKTNQPFHGLGELKLRFFDDHNTVRFDLTDDELLDEVTDELDETVDEVGGGFGDMTEIPQIGLATIITTCEKLVKKEPAFLDGYAHWVGALVSIEKNAEAISVGFPALNAAFKLLEAAPQKYQVSYYELPNRPFFRLAHNLVLAYYGANKNNEAKELAEKMLKLWPNDNSGFRFLLEPDSD